jgi:hypothetical protein
MMSASLSEMTAPVSMQSVQHVTSFNERRVSEMSVLDHNIFSFENNTAFEI